MTLATVIALLGALNGAAEVILKITEDMRAAGHPVDAPLLPEHMTAIFSALKKSAESIPEVHQQAISTALDTWDENHAGE